eukprot:CAMPEP_0170856342 /NCGR_PEP_ID=MMETSP0734-20130129/14534_1 /TAXON_ID=186038 /ORGANISM="Fragilariopsis kerguelensis, Strain L26-C5" /LENGTH=455 /DNA_ID=CAMNT_0011228159 /DNA_START=75 /DNA_END=1439 /DNA_ORIENTATION=-
MTTIASNYPMGNNTSNNDSIHSHKQRNNAVAMPPPRPPDRKQPSQDSRGRPPKKLRAKSQQQQRPAFRQKVSSANQTAICTTTSQKVGRRTLRDLFDKSGEEAYIVPIFQRRYCWNQTQWDTLWHDVLKRRSLKHSLGRLTCTNITVLGERSVIIDGQQRLTTTTLLLAAIRDAALLSLDEKTSDNKQQQEQQQHQTEALVRGIHDMLFLDQTAMQEWITSDSASLSEGQELEFCRLVPTFCDRSSYLAAILPPSAKQVQVFLSETYHRNWHRPLSAKEHFATHISSLLASSSRSPYQVLEKLTGLLLDGIDMLYFPIDIDRGYHDGTEDTQVIYERLAIRDATWCKPSRKSEYHSMDGTDMIRNLCLGSFSTTASKSSFYEHYWLPLERMFQTTVGDNGNDDDDDNVNDEESLHQILMAFLNDPKTTQACAEYASNSSGPKVIGGRIYHDFETW